METRGPDPQLNEVLERAAEGDGQAWRTLVESYSRRVYGLLVRQCGDRELAEEITQGTFVQVVKHIGRYRERGKFEAWIFRIAMNRLRDEMRRRKRHARSMDMSQGRSDEPGSGPIIEDQIAASEVDGTQDPARRVDRAEQIELLKAAIAKMSPADQQILHLRHTAGLSFAQVADTLGEPLGTVLARGHRALAKLRKLLGDEVEE